jgi:nucleoside 2-deoxyribosyltransferase
MKEIKAPNKYNFQNSNEHHVPSIFLAGSIEMGIAENWQTKIANALKDFDVCIFNPRRDNWDASWVQNKDNPQFREQVEWELNALDNADLVVFYFDPNTKSPISLLEFGLFAEKNKKVIVCCPKGFYRKGNIDILSEKDKDTEVNTLEELIEKIKEKLSLGK